MYKKYLIYALLFTCGIHAQISISGHLDLKDQVTKEHKIYLYQLKLEGVKNSKIAKEIAWSPIGTDGSFSFKSELLSNEDSFYQLGLNRLGATYKDTIAKSNPFILSRRDSIDFKPEFEHFSKYTTTNEADKEWKRLRDFEQRLQKLDNKFKNNDNERKSYLKDSLRILMVKLIAVQQLEDKDLLDKDIVKNPNYYLTLLKEFQESKLPSSEYQFFEKKLAFLTKEFVQQKYAWSKVTNVILGLIILVLIYFLFFKRKYSETLPELSKQELTIKRLILDGKSNKEIANELFISISTVKTHITNIYSKLNVANRKELLQKKHN